MRNLKKTIKKIKGTTVGVVNAKCSLKEVKAAYLKAFAKYLEATLPEELKYYSVRTTKVIGPEDGLKGGAVALKKNLIDDMTIRIVFGQEPAQFKERESVQLLVNVPHPINYYRRLKKSTNVFEFIQIMRRRYDVKDEEAALSEALADINKYFDYLEQCLREGVIPLTNIKEEE